MIRAARVGEQRAVVWKRLYEPLRGQLVGGRGRHRAAEGAELPEAGVVDQDQQHVRRARRGRDRLRETRGGPESCGVVPTVPG